jgi:hypothetical protein
MGNSKCKGPGVVVHSAGLRISQEGQGRAGREQGSWEATEGVEKMGHPVQHGSLYLI